MKIERNAFIELIKQNVAGGNIGELAPETRLADMGIDSLGFATLLFAIEDFLKIRIDEQELDGLNGNSTVAQFVETFHRLGYEIEV